MKNTKHLQEVAPVADALFFENLEKSVIETLIIESKTNYIQFANPSFLSYFGLQIEAIINKNICEISGFEKDFQDKIINPLQENKIVTNVELQLKDKKGFTFRFLVFTQPINYQQKKCFLFSFINISIVKRAKGEANNLIKYGCSLQLDEHNCSLKTESQYSLSLIEASRDPLFAISPEGKITDTNQATVRATDVPKNELIGSDFINYFTDKCKAKESYEAVFSKGFISDFPLTIKDHKFTDVLFNGSVYKSAAGKIIGAVMVARDITEQKRLEHELTEAKIFAEEATSIAEEAKIIAEKAKNNAEQAVQSKQQFLSNMSHEIRTPMNAIDRKSVV